MNLKDENYINIQGWMVNTLNLKGNELIIYAIIYGFSQAENQTYSGGLQYLADWTGSTKQGVIKNLKSLIDKKYIVKNETMLNNVKFCEYYCTKVNGIKLSLTGGIKLSLPNNKIINNNIYNKKEEIINTNNKEEKKEEENLTILYDPKVVEEVEESKDNIKYQDILDLYHQICTSLSKVFKLTDSRKKSINARLNEKDITIDTFKEVFTKAQNSRFLTGNNDRGFKADFDWLLNQSNFYKTLEGKYDNKISNNQNQSSSNNKSKKVYDYSDPSNWECDF